MFVDKDDGIYQRECIDRIFVGLYDEYDHPYIEFSCDEDRHIEDVFSTCWSELYDVLEQDEFACMWEHKNVDGVLKWLRPIIHDLVCSFGNMDDARKQLLTLKTLMEEE